MWRRGIEFAALYLGLPVVLASLLNGKPFWLVLWVAAGTIGALLWHDPGFDNRRFLRLDAPRHSLRPVLLRFVLLAAATTLVVAWFKPEALFAFPRQHPGLWMLIMIGYPIVSVYPQGIIYRALFFHRYAALFPHPALRLAAAAVVFSLGHLMFMSPWTLLLTFAGGFLFAQTYTRSRSLLLASIEHALYGCAMFTIGLGHLIYHGAAN